MDGLIKAIRSRLHALFAGQAQQSTIRVTITFNNGEELEVPDADCGQFSDNGVIHAVIPCKGIVLAVGQDKLLRLPVYRLGVTSHGAIQLLDIRSVCVLFRSTAPDSPPRSRWD